MHNRLILLRENLGKKQSEFAKMLGITQAFLSEIEKGKRNLSLNILLKVSTLDVSLDWLVNGYGSMFRSGSQSQLLNIPDPNGNLSTALKMLSVLPEEKQKDCLNFIWDKKLFFDLKNEVEKLRSEIKKHKKG